ncbi:hypothetical protein ACFPA1_26675 [Neobacillus sp. GCM10023253]
MGFKMKKKKKEEKGDKWEFFESGFDLIEPIYLLIRWGVRVIIKILH